MGTSGAASDVTGDGNAEAGAAGTLSVAEGSLPAATAAGTSCDSVAFSWTFGWTAADVFLSAAVAGSVAAEAGWTEALGWLGTSFVVAAIDPGVGAGALEFDARSGLNGEALLAGLLALLL